MNEACIAPIKLCKFIGHNAPKLYSFLDIRGNLHAHALKFWWNQMKSFSFEPFFRNLRLS